MSNGKRVAKNSLFQAVAFTAQGATEFLVALILARLAGPELLGQFTTLVILAGVFAFFSAVGLSGALSPAPARLRHDRGETAPLPHTPVGFSLPLTLLVFS